MDTHPSYGILSPLLEKYPKSSASFFQTYNDITYAQKWQDVHVEDLSCCSRGVIKGRKPEGGPLLFVIPCSLSESLSFDWLQNAFKELFPQPTSTAETLFIYLAITSSDASIVYYKLNQGIVKPSV
ncbi:tRNA intron endonuclease [Crepidotus variabilis]|uniref:tRNA intron endonuclease n=1 Tax=Crepidotus variabilis TaxID=179855 RepID=A0A9P6E7V0_9AGAR|nr:tRNA intron endonuclease [Crepidotus variabilis]